MPPPTDSTPSVGGPLLRHGSRVRRGVAGGASEQRASAGRGYGSRGSDEPQNIRIKYGKPKADGSIFRIFADVKTKNNKPIVGENLLYFMVWTMAILVPILNSKMMSEEHVYLVNILTAWSKLLPYFIIFLINNALLAPKLLLRKHYAAYLTVSALMLAGIFYSLEYYQESMRLSPVTGNGTYIVHGRASFTDLTWYWNTLLGIFLLGANSGIKYMFKSMKDEQKMVALERQSLRAEMDYLKYQINPHFFMNTLNNIHALIDIDAEAAKETVIELSKMMRYVLYDSESAETSVAKDIRFVKNYINLMRIRYTSDIDIRFDVQAPLPTDAKIPPLLLIVFVENAFKHGVSYNEPSFVHIALGCEDGRAVCEVRNSRHASAARKTEGSGMGLENARKRLDLLFGDDYELRIDDSRENEYGVKLTIPIKQ